MARGIAGGVNVLSICWALARDENGRRRIAGEGEMRHARGLRVERSRPELLSRGVVCRLPVAEVPFAGNDRREAVVTMGVRRDARMRRDLQFDGIRASLGGIA